MNRSTSRTMGSIGSIAVIDDAFQAIDLDRLPEPERDAAVRALSKIDGEAQADIVGRGFEMDVLTTSPNVVLDALTDPERPLGEAFAHFQLASETLGRRIETRHAVRLLVAHLRAVSGAALRELVPDGTSLDLSGFDLIFLDCFLEDGSYDTDAAQGIARDIARAADFESSQQLVLMSSSERARMVRRQFRAGAGIEGTAFLFVSKSELDQKWKVQAHLNMLACARPNSVAVADYVRSAKANVKAAAETLAELLDDLDLADFAHVQNLALQEDGHPLGQYLSWLFSSHLRALSFEGDLRNLERRVDSLSFDESLISPGQVSGLVTTFHHSAIFASGLGPLRGHPLADAEEPGPPVVRLGDVFLDPGAPRHSSS